MKIMVIPDVHWSQNSSIIRSEGSYTSTRLENLIKSMNWVEELAWNLGCQSIIGLGDFFDSTQLNSKEISALQYIRWAPISHVFITGNHETSVSNLEYSTSDLFKLLPNSVVINSPQCNRIDSTDLEFCFLPYILERDRKPLAEYFPPSQLRRIIFSHNDLKDVQYGPFLSKEGFTVSEIEANCELFMNGHIHHCSYVTSKIINCGNLTGQNFTEDAYKYDHCVQVIDTDTLKVDFYINPNAFNFYKIDLTSTASFGGAFSTLLTSQLKPNAVLTLKVLPEDVDTARKLLAEHTDIIYRLIVENSQNSSEDLTNIQFEAVDHLKQFQSYVLENIGNSDIIQEELLNVMK